LALFLFPFKGVFGAFKIIGQDIGPGGKSEEFSGCGRQEAGFSPIAVIFMIEPALVD
jgi:hypothetical protein